MDRMFIGGRSSGRSVAAHMQALGILMQGKHVRAFAKTYKELNNRCLKIVEDMDKLFHIETSSKILGDCILIKFSNGATLEGVCMDKESHGQDVG